MPVELNKKELLRRDILGEELIVYGRLPMMLSAQCVNKTMHGCDKAEKTIFLKDRYANEFPCMNFCGECTNIIYNSVPLFLTKKDGIIDRLSPRLLRLDFTDEEQEEIVNIIKYYVNIRNDSENELSIPVDKYTKGHLNRGVE